MLLKPPDAEHGLSCTIKNLTYWKEAELFVEHGEIVIWQGIDTCHSQGGSGH